MNSLNKLNFYYLYKKIIFENIHKLNNILNKDKYFLILS